MRGSEVVFFIKRCENKTYCAKPEVIDAFIKDLTVDFWTVENTVDLAVYGKEPVYKSYILLGQHVLDPDYAPRFTVHLEKVNYFTKG